MKGYRTVFLNIAMTMAMGGTIQLAELPPNIRAWLTLGAAVWGFAAILLRLATTTPIGQRVEAKLEADLGITPDEMAALVGKLPQVSDLDALTRQGQAIAESVAAVRAALPASPNTPA